MKVLVTLCLVLLASSAVQCQDVNALLEALVGRMASWGALGKGFAHYNPNAGCTFDGMFMPPHLNKEPMNRKCNQDKSIYRRDAVTKVPFACKPNMTPFNNLTKTFQASVRPCGNKCYYVAFKCDTTKTVKGGFSGEIYFREP